MKTDEELFLSGGDTAMTELVGRYERPLFRFLLHLTNDAQLAEDVFQESFLRLHRSRSTYRSDQALKPYLYRIALNALRDQRSRQRPSVPLETAALQSQTNPALRASGPRPDDAYETSETQRHIRAALVALPESEREVVVLRVFEDLSFPEIARIVDIPIPTAKSRMLYALRRMKPALERYLSGASNISAKDLAL